MLPLESKVIEKIVYIQLQSYLDSYNLISFYQSGFRKNHNCESLITLIITKWKIEIHDRKVIVAVFLDLKRAFETVDRDILLQKLDRYGIRNTELNWFKSYLLGRRQKTKVNNLLSDATNVNFGVPQGSLLGVLLFLIYINDMEKKVVHSKLMLFADDALLFVSDVSVDEGIDKINSDLKELQNWFQMNKLKLNINKTKAMILNGSTRRSICIDNEPIEIIDEIKYLGILIDNKLTFNAHVEHVCKKVARKLHFFARIRKRISKICAIRVYNTIIKPHFEYCSSVTFMCNDYMLDRLQKLQNRGMRIILQCNRRTHITDMLAQLSWMSINQRIIFNVLVFVYKMKFKLLPAYLNDNITYVNDVQPYPLRNANNFRLLNFRNQITGNMVMHKGLSIFNKLPNEIKNEENIYRFKKLTINFIKHRFR